MYTIYLNISQLKKKAFFFCTIFYYFPFDLSFCIDKCCVAVVSDFIIVLLLLVGLHFNPYKYPLSSVNWKPTWYF